MLESDNINEYPEFPFVAKSDHGTIFFKFKYGGREIENVTTTLQPTPTAKKSPSKSRYSRFTEGILLITVLWFVIGMIFCVSKRRRSCHSCQSGKKQRQLHATNLSTTNSSELQAININYKS